MENQLFQLKFTAKQLNKMSVKSEKEEKKELAKVKKAMEKGNTDGARIYAQNAIRQKNQAMIYLRLASRMDAVASRVETAVKMNMITKSMGMVVKGMDKALQAMDVEKITKIMDNFERSFEETDVRSEYVEQAINTSTAMTSPEDEVESLMQRVADEHGLETAHQFGALEAPTKAAAQAAPVTASEEDELAMRLRALRAQA